MKCSHREIEMGISSNRPSWKYMEAGPQTHEKLKVSFILAGGAEFCEYFFHFCRGHKIKDDDSNSKGISDILCKFLDLWCS